MTETMSSAEQRIAALSPEQRELLLRRLRERSAAPPAEAPAPEIPAIPDGPFDPREPSPLSDIQAAFWMGGSGLYDLGGSSANVFVEYEFPGVAEELAERLNPVLARAVARHPMLRTVVTADGNQRVLAETPPYEVGREDLSRLSEEEIERHLESTRDRLRYSRHPSDRWPLFDMVLLQLPQERIRFQARFDAMLVDGTSRTLLMDELIRGVVETIVGGEPSDPPAPEVTYLDYVRALEAFRQSATWERCRAYWHERLPSLPGAPRLPLARDFGPETVPRVVWRNTTVLAPAPWAGLCQRAAHRGITPSGIGSALVAETLRSWSEEPSFTLGLAGAYYPPIHPQIRQVIGTFTTLYLLEAEAGAGPFAERARRLQDRLNADLDHQHFSGHEALRELNRMRRAGGRATLPIQFTSILRSGGPVPPEEEPEEAPQAPQGQGPILDLTQIDLMIAMPQVLLFWVLGEASDRSLFLISQTVEEVFPPDLVADMIEGCRRLAARLAEDDAAWSDPRPLRFSNQAPAPAGPKAPESTEEPGLAALVARQARVRPEAPALVTAGRTVSYGELERWPEPARPVAAELEPVRQQSDAALAALRSGESRDGVAAAARELGRLAGLGPDDRLLALSLPGSDLSSAEILAGFAAGAAVILPTPAERTPEALADLAARERVTVWSSAPAVLEAALDRVERKRRLKLRTLRRVLLHRDRVPVGLPERLRALGGDVQAFATWGTAGAPVAAAGPLQGEEGTEVAGSCPPLEATAGWRLQVLDQDLVPRPAWVPGDLYLGDGAETGERLQPTGERARRLPDGRIELLGTEPAPPAEALGYGADPRRVEETLQRHPAVRHAVVAWRGPERRLAAWVVLRSGRTLSDNELRAHLRASLPEHLLPATLVRLNELPLTPEGRVDRSALAVPAAAPRRAEARWSAAATELAGLWEEVLGRRPASLEDDFLELGGNSLLATRLLGRAAERFGLKTPLASFLDRPTLGRLAELLERAREQRPDWKERFPLRHLQNSLAALHARLLPPSTSPAYGMRVFTLLWISQFVSSVGTGLGSFALGVWIYRQNASATQYAMMPFLATCTALLVSPLAGVLADRWDRRRLILLGDSGAAIMTCLMALALFTDQMRLWHVYIIIFFMVGFSSLQGPAMAASVSMLVPRRQLARMSGINQAAGVATALVCPPLAGALVPAIGYHGVIAIDVTTFFFALLVLLAVRLPRPVADREQRERRSMLGDLLFGWSYLRQRPGLLHLLTLFAATNFCLGIVQVLLTPLLLSFASATELGTVQAASAAGGLLGSVALSLWGGPRHRVLGTLLFLLLQAPILLLGGLQPSVALIAVATFVFTGLNPFVSGLSQAIWQSKVAHAVQGRVLAIRSVIGGAAAPLAFLIAGPLADRVFEPLMAPGGALASTVGQVIGVGRGRGVGLLFMTLGLFIMLIVLLFSLSPRLRRVETEIPDAAPASEPAPGGQPTETSLQRA